MHKLNKKNIILVIALGLIGCQLVLAEVDCDTLEGKDKDRCESLEKKAKVYESIIKLKDKQQDTLANQIDVIDQDQAKTKQDLQSIQKNLDDLNQRINGLEGSIQEKETLINVQKRILSGLMQSYYDYDQQGVLHLMLLNENFSETLNQSDYLQQSGIKVGEVLGELEKNKQQLVSDRKELEDKKMTSEDLKNQLVDKNYDLQAKENQKQSLLIQTQGEEAKYKDLLAHVEKQKQELFNFSEASNEAEISASVSSYPKPKDNLASTSWYFSQKDSRWGNKTIGNSKTLMKDYGCAVTAVSMVFRKYGSSIDPGKMAKEKIFYYDLIKWPATWTPGITLASSIGHGNIKWSAVDSQIKKGKPVIVYIKKTNGRGGHYVVVTGKDSKDYIVHDPYFGPNLYLGTSKSLVGKIGADSSVKIDQMIIYN